MVSLRAAVAVATALLLCSAPAALASAGWTETGGIEKREAQAGVTLADGSVLVAGGENNTAIWPEAWRYSEATGVWAPTGGMSISRSHFTATRLLDGRVLVTGGTSHSPGVDVADSAELYDPASGTWSPAAAMGAERFDHVATLLADGRVLVAGGRDRLGVLRSAELYDPAANTWSPAAPMTDTRFSPTATRLADGRVLVTGGGTDAGLSQKTTELYDPATNAWSPGPDLDIGRRFHTASLLPGGTVLIAGGLGTRQTLLYDPPRNAFDPGPELPLPRELQTATALPGGDVLLAGGYSSDGPNSSALVAASLRYRHGTRTWVAAGTLHESRSDHVAAALPDGRVVVVGGNSTGFRTGSAELWTPPVTTVAAPASVDFGAVSVPTDRTVTVTNTGADELLIDDLKATGAAFAVVADTCSPAPVAAGASCTVTLRFAPPALGAHAGALTFAANSTPGTVTVSLSGSGAPTTSPFVAPPAAKHTTMRVKVSGRISGRSRCAGKATLTLLAGKRRVGRATVHLTSRCRYSKTFKVRSDEVGRHTRLTLQRRYAGRTSHVTVKLKV